MPRVEASEFAHEVIEATRRGSQLAQRMECECAHTRGPQEEREMREIAALEEGLQDRIHVRRLSAVRHATF